MIEPKRIILALVLLLLLFKGGHAQRDYHRFYTAEDGMPSNQVYDAHQDQSGQMWFATDRGISSFNGSYFVNYELGDGLEDNVVYGFYPQSDGTIWCATQSCRLFYFHPKEKKFKAYQYNHLIENYRGKEIKGLKVLNESDIEFRFLCRLGYVEIKAGKLKDNCFEFESASVSQEMQGVDDIDTISYCYYDSEKGYVYPAPRGIPGEQKIERVCINYFFERSGRIYSATSNGFDIFEKGNKVIDYQVSEEYASVTNLESLDNGFWLTTRTNGVKLFDFDGNEQKQLLPSNVCSSYFLDKNGGEWVTTLYNGVAYYPNYPIDLLHEVDNQEVNRLSVDGDNNLLIGMSEPWIYHLNLSDQKITRYATPGSPGEIQYSYYDNYLYSNIKGKEHLSRFVRRYSDNRKEPILICFGKYLLDGQKEVVYKGEDFHYDAEYFEDEKVLASGTRILRLDKNGKAFGEIDLKVRTNDLDVEEHQIFCGTKGKGIVVLDKDLNIVDSIGKDEGLKNLFVNEILFESSGKLWICTENGLFLGKQQGTGWSLSAIKVAHGLLSNKVVDIEILNGVAYVGTAGGVSYFRLSDLPSILGKGTQISFEIDEVMVGADAFKPELYYYQNTIDIRYSLTAFLHNADIQFRYKISPLSKEWQYTNDRNIRFDALPDGSYLIEIQPVVNEEPKESLSKSIAFTIHPAFYRTWWFIACIVLSIALIIWLFFKYRILKYNRELVREILRHLLRRIRPETNSFVVRSNGSEVKINSSDVLYVVSNSNYINIYTTKGKITTRLTLGNFMSLIPDPIEYLQIRRSIIVRIDQVQEKSINTVTVGDEELKVGRTYAKELGKIQL